MGERHREAAGQDRQGSLKLNLFHQTPDIILSQTWLSSSNAIIFWLTRRDLPKGRDDTNMTTQSDDNQLAMEEKVSDDIRNKEINEEDDEDVTWRLTHVTTVTRDGLSHFWWHLEPVTIRGLPSSCLWLGGKTMKARSRKTTITAPGCAELQCHQISPAHQTKQN